MKYTIEQQREYLDDRLIIESLCSNKQNREAVKKFIQATKGNNISNYLQNESWQDDKKNNTKVFLVKDKVTDEIAFFFAINCGILFSELEVVKLEDKEVVPFNKYVDAVRTTLRKGVSEVEKDIANNQMYDAMQELWEAVDDSDRVEYLFSVAGDKANTLSEKDDNVLKEEEKFVQNVQETFPAVDIKYFGRNKAYTAEIDLDFRLGVYVFWEIIVPHILKLAESVGCKYVYLFAADKTEAEENLAAEGEMAFDYDDCDIAPEMDNIKKLVDYYIKELKFQSVTRYKILKPFHERGCYTLVQEIEKLPENRKSVWDTHSTDNDEI